MDEEVLVGVLLAAGAGRRLGLGPKALLPVDHTPDSQPQVARMVRALWDGGCDEVIVVAGAEAARVQRALGTCRHRVVVNEEWATGMASSFRVGVAAANQILEGRGGGSVMVALVDQPDIDDRVVSHLKAKALRRRVTAAGFPGLRGELVRGHPIIFPADLARDAAALAEGDAGGRVWLRANLGLIDVVDAGHLATGRDVDTPADLHHWVNERRVEDGTA